MNPSTSAQLIGNLCVGLAALIYAVPLQILLLELSRKRDDGGGLLAGIILILPMWLLLMTTLFCVTASGGFDGLRLSRGWLYALVVVATLAMTALSFMVFEFPRHSDFVTRFIGRVPIYVLPATTMLLAILALNPRLAPTIPLPPVKLTWLICAGLSLLLCGGFLGWRFLVLGKANLTGLASAMNRRGVSDQEILAKLQTLDLQRDFTDLLRHASQYQSRVVRETATARLRTHPDFLAALIANLSASDPSAGLEFLCSATLSPDEQTRLALPTRSAIEHFTDDIPAPNYMSSDRRKQLLSWGKKALPVIAKKFTATDVDFAPTLAAFEHALRPDDNRRR